VGYVDALVERGYVAYRGNADAWHSQLPRPIARAARLMDAFLPIPPRNAAPVVEGPIVNVPATYLYLHRKGWARLVPLSFRVSKAVSALRRAANEGAMFHMWFHPFNLASDPEALLGGLETIFQEAATLRASGLLVNETMGSLAQRVAPQGARKGDEV
jgi:hypothetical protein